MFSICINERHCERSEAIQGVLPQSSALAALDCRVAALLAMTFGAKGCKPLTVTNPICHPLRNFVPPRETKSRENSRTTRGIF
ncbi:MAG: hypothetical protein COZ43_12370 [Sphingomonadales bacterium CG_4_10_14_3_um_filter_58_15]|nr:MAG: hypothetical protein COZ43_12370 [Sphingomonadales bacterium CG_4_10_14_3_um_filter_58_15]